MQLTGFLATVPPAQAGRYDRARVRPNDGLLASATPKVIATSMGFSAVQARGARARGVGLGGGGAGRWPTVKIAGVLPQECGTALVQNYSIVCGDDVRIMMLW